MNQLPAYEQWIAENIEGIEVPDMADAIWNRIEAALDVEMPADNNTQAPSKGNSFFNNPATLIIGAGIIAVIITLFIIFRHGNLKSPPPKNIPQQSVPAPATQPELPPPHRDTIKQDVHAPSTQSPVVNNDVKHTVDTGVYNIFANDKRDSLLKPKDSLRLPTVKPSIDIMRPKQYGVPVPDSGYRMKTGKE